MAPRTVYANLADGLQPLGLFDQSLADMGNLGMIPCTASGTNAVVLTPIPTAFAPTITIPNQLQNFTFVAAGNSTGPITIQIGTASALNLYKEDGATQASTNDLLNKVLYGIVYNSALNSGSGGYQIVFPITSVINPIISGATISNSTYNGNTWTPGTGTLTIAAGKTLKADNSLELAGTDGTVMTFPAISASVLTTAAAVTIGQGGTGQTTAAPAFDALSPTTTRGDLIARGGASNARLALGTSGYALLSNGTDPAWTGFLQSGTGAATRTWNAKSSDIFSVTDFSGVDPTGVSDSTTGLNAAIVAANSASKTLYWPSGTYLISGTLTAPASGAVWLGSGYNTTIIKTSSATLDIITVTNGAFLLRDIQFQASVTRSAGNFVNITAAGIVIMDSLYFQAPFHGLGINNASAVVYLSHSFFNATVATTGVSIEVDACNVFTMMNVLANNSSGARPFAHLNIVSDGNISAYDCQFLQAASNVSITPSSGSATLFKATNCYFDSAGTYGVNVSPTGTGSVTHLSLVQCWFSSAGSAGILMSATGSATISGVSIVDPQVYVGVYGIYASGTGVKYVSVLGGQIAGCTSSAINIVDATHGVVSGALIGPVGTGTNANGITMSGAADFWNISGNDVTGNTTTNISNTSSGTHNRIEKNIGYNPVGGAAVTTGASPWSYTAGSSPETLYMSASTSITGITQGGVGLPISSSANQLVTVNLSPNETVSGITYTGTLTAKKVIQ